jgi:hypothetical protein
MMIWNAAILRQFGGGLSAFTGYQHMRTSPPH